VCDNGPLCRMLFLSLVSMCLGLWFSLLFAAGTFVQVSSAAWTSAIVYPADGSSVGQQLSWYSSSLWFLVVWLCLWPLLLVVTPCALFNACNKTLPDLTEACASAQGTLRSPSA
jgi:hypothetical protein